MKALILILSGLVAVLQGCAATDPLLDVNDWQPSGVNEMNIAAQSAHPRDLERGQEASGGSDGELAAAAILRLRTGHVKKLPASGVTDLQVQSAPGSAGP